MHIKESRATPKVSLRGGTEFRRRNRVFSLFFSGSRRPLFGARDDDTGGIYSKNIALFWVLMGLALLFYGAALVYMK